MATRPSRYTPLTNTALPTHLSLHRLLFCSAPDNSPNKSTQLTSHLIKVPKMGDSITEGTIAKWAKLVGDTVQLDDVICVIDSDKVSIEIHADVAGTIAKHAADEGEIVFVGSDLVTLEVSDGGVEEKIDTTTQQLKAADSVAAKYNPMIKFPIRNAVAEKKYDAAVDQAGRIVTPQNKTTESTDSSLQKKADVTWSEDDRHSAKYIATPMTEEEIEVINMGGTSDLYEQRVGRWINAVQQIKGNMKK